MPAPLSTLVLGLGLFFLGIQLIGMSLRQLAGESFRTLVQRTTHSPLQASLVGLLFGGLMQSATAVTFILVGLASSGLITTAAALPIIAWCNVGLTALAFVTTLDIHPLVAWLVGGSGIAWGVLKRAQPHAGAGVLLGMGLILFGLETMSHGVAPLATMPWFQQMLAIGLGHPVLSFVTGIAAAALLQSNTGASMLVITLAGSGLFRLPEAALLIYGTNLGAIPLRAILAFGLRGRSLRLVRMEDLFCVDQRGPDARARPARIRGRSARAGRRERGDARRAAPARAGVPALESPARRWRSRRCSAGAIACSSACFPTGRANRRARRATSRPRPSGIPAPPPCCSSASWRG